MSGPDPSNTISTGASGVPCAHIDPSWHQTRPVSCAVAWLGLAVVLINCAAVSVAQPLTQVYVRVEAGLM